MDTVKKPRSRPIGGTVGLVFGGLWSMLGASALPPAWQTPAALAGLAVTVALIVLLWRTASPGGGTRLFGRWAYLLAVALEVAALVVANNLLPRYGLGAYLIPAVGIIVGLHFIGLWKATGLVRFLWIAGAMCAVSAAAAALPALHGAIHLRDVAAGFGNALVLWIGAGRPNKPAL
jgi:hypothetical protein